MTDENKETSEDTPAPEETPAEEPQVESAETPAEEPQAESEETPAEEPQAESEETPVESDETPTEEAPDAPGSEAEEAAVDGEAPPSADDDPSDTPSEEAEGPDAAAESPGAPEPEAKKDKKDVIPGADLEPIAVESSEERPLSAEERARREAEEEERAQREAALSGDGEEESSAASRAPAKMESGARFQATGKRKCSIARVTLLPGAGKFEINGRSLEEFFPRPLHQTMAKQPLASTGYETSVDVRVRVHGGGIGGQAGAVRHGISRALTEIDPELRGELKRRGYLTRDARVKERRKAGLKKARKKPQFSKR
jgi:small subunit ribosomal protein S9